MIRATTIVILLLFSASWVSAQKILKVEGTSQVRVENNMSKDMARDLAREKAKILAIESVLGSYLEQTSYMDLEDGQTSFTIIGETKVRGEWLKTDKETFGEDIRKIRGPNGVENEVWITCDIKGKIREITSAPMDLQVSSLNCADRSCETNEFNNGESLFIHFKAPENGFVSIYLTDENKAYRLLPYLEMPGYYLNGVPVKADQPYVFFSTDFSHDYFEDYPYYLNDELFLEAENKTTLFKLYVVFSPKEFRRPIVEDEEIAEAQYVIPKSLSRRNFEVWVQDNRLLDDDFHYRSLNLRVDPN